jgi:hypothetical protein
MARNMLPEERSIGLGIYRRWESIDADRVTQDDVLATYQSEIEAQQLPGLRLWAAKA